VGGRESSATWRLVSLVENVLVLALGREFEVHQHETPEQMGATSAGMRGDSQEVRFGRATNVTVQVSIEQGALITLARQRGVMTLLLRNPNDIETNPDRPDIVIQDILDPARRGRFLRRTVAVAHAAVPAAPAVEPAAGP